MSNRYNNKKTGPMYVIFNMKTNTFLSFANRWIKDRERAACWTIVQVAAKRRELLTLQDQYDTIVTER